MISTSGERIRHLQTRPRVLRWSRGAARLRHRQITGDVHCVYSQVCSGLRLVLTEMLISNAERLQIASGKPVCRYAGILSAYGMALADVVHEAQEPCAAHYKTDAFHMIDARIDELSQQCVDELKQQGFDRLVLFVLLVYNCGRARKVASLLFGGDGVCRAWFWPSPHLGYVCKMREPHPFCTCISQGRWTSGGHGNIFHKFFSVSVQREAFLVLCVWKPAKTETRVGNEKERCFYCFQGTHPHRCIPAFALRRNGLCFDGQRGEIISSGLKHQQTWRLRESFP